MRNQANTSPSPQPSPSVAVRHRELDEKTSVVAVVGDLDLFSAPSLKWALVDLVGAGYSQLVVDLSRVSFMDSTAVGVLVGVNRSLDRGSRLAIVCSQPNLLRIFEASGLDATFALFPDVDEAVAHARAQATGGDDRTTPDAPTLAPDAAMVLGIATTAMPFARTREEQAERWLRVLRLHGEVGVALRGLGVTEASDSPLGASPGGDSSGAGTQEPDVIARVTEDAGRIAQQRGAGAVATTDVLLAVMHAYGADFDRILLAHGTTADELIERLGAGADEIDNA